MLMETPLLFWYLVALTVKDLNIKAKGDLNFFCRSGEHSRYRFFLQQLHLMG